MTIQYPLTTTTQEYGMNYNKNYNNNDDDELEALLKQELSYYPNHLHYPITKITKRTTCRNTTISSSSLSLITKTNRQQIIDWIIQILDVFGFSSATTLCETIVVCIDRYWSSLLSSSSSSYQSNTNTDNVETQRRHYQLVALTAVYTIIKTHCQESLSLSIIVNHLGQNRFTEHDITSMERQLLHTVQWKIHPPTVLDFVRIYLNDIVSSALVVVVSNQRYYESLYDLARYQAAIAIKELSSFGGYCYIDDISHDDNISDNIQLSSSPSPSQIALAILWNTIECISCSSDPQEQQEKETIFQRIEQHLMRQPLLQGGNESATSNVFLLRSFHNLRQRLYCCIHDNTISDTTTAAAAAAAAAVSTVEEQRQQREQQQDDEDVYMSSTTTATARVTVTTTTATSVTELQKSSRLISSSLDDEFEDDVTALPMSTDTISPRSVQI